MVRFGKMAGEVVDNLLMFGRAILEGQIISDNDLCLKRPGTGLFAKYRKHIVGSKAARNLTEGKMLEFGDFCG